MDETLLAPPRYFCYSVDHGLRDKNSLRTWDVKTQQPESLSQYDQYISYFDSLFAEQLVERKNGDDVREFLAYHCDYFVNSVGGDKALFVHHLKQAVVPKIEKSASEQVCQAMLVWLFVNTE